MTFSAPSHPHQLSALSPLPAYLLEVDAELIVLTFRTPSFCHCGPGDVYLRDALHQVLCAQVVLHAGN